MNAQQRRTRYRQIKALSLQNVRMVMKTGVVHHAVKVGLTDRVDHLASTSKDYAYRGRRPSLWRVKIEWNYETVFKDVQMIGGASPLLHRIEVSA